MSMTTKYFVDGAGNYLGAFDGYVDETGKFVAPAYPVDAIEIETPPPSGDARQKSNPATRQWQTLPPLDLSVMDQDTLNAALTQKGSVIRALALVVLDQINELRIKTGDKAYTMPQFMAALKAKMR